MYLIGNGNVDTIKTLQQGEVHFESILVQANMIQNTDAWGGRRKRLVEDINRKVDIFQGHCHMKMMLQPSSIDPKSGLETNSARIGWQELHDKCGKFITDMIDYKKKQRQDKDWIS